MSSQLSPDPLAPPYVSVTVLRLDRPENDTRSVLIAYQTHGVGPYQHMVVEVDRYSPEWSILRTAAEMLLAVESAQEAVTSDLLKRVWARAASEYLAPF